MSEFESGPDISTREPVDLRPMEGLRVIDLSRVLAGPTVSRLMAELGAEVIKVETPKGDPSRKLPHLKNGRSGYYIQQNRGKRSVCLNLRNQRGMDVLHRLIKTSDVLVENFRPGVLENMGLDWPRLREINPRLILCSVTALGYGGPLSRLPGYDTVGAGYSGVASLSGPPDGPPMMPNAAIGDASTGMHGFAAVAVALFNRERTGRGDWVQVSLIDTYINAHEINIQALTGSDGAVVPESAANRHKTVCPTGMFRSGESYVFIAVVSEGDWPRLCKAMNRPELIDDPRVATNEDRVENADFVYEAIEQWLDEIGDNQRAVEIMIEQEVAAAPILTVAEAIDHPHNVARRAVRTVKDDAWGEITIPGMPIRFAGYPDELPLRSEDLGESSAPVLKELLGYSNDEIRSLAVDGAVLGRFPEDWETIVDYQEGVDQC